MKTSMFKRSNPLKCAALTVVLLMGLAQPAHAYIDPGSGMFVLQILGVFLASMLFFGRQLIYQAVDRLRRLRAKILGRSESQPSLSDPKD